MPYDVHVVRSEDWLDAADAPIERSEVDRVVAGDPELAWSETEFVELAGEGGEPARYYAITWQGNACFYWLDNEVRCSGPEEPQIVKLVEIAGRLEANVVGDDGERYTVEGDGDGGLRLVTSE